MTRRLRLRVERCEKQQQASSLAKQRLTRGVWIQEATSSSYLWATQHTKTRNEHWREEGRPSAYEPFPQHPYLKNLFEFLERERIVFFVKSRDMMVSWVCVTYLTLQAMTIPAAGVLFQTQKEDKVIQLIDYSKILWEQQDRRLKEAFPLSKPMSKQSSRCLEFKHGGYIQGIPGGANQLRSYHPFAYFNDESAFQPDAGECYNEALSAVSGKIIFNSSAYPGWYADVCRGIVRNSED